MKISFFKCPLFILGSLFLYGCVSHPPRPNILFVLADDHRWDLIGKYHSIVKTPTLDELATRGTVFENAFVTSPICAASRATILTGLTERTHQYTFKKPPIAKQYLAKSYPYLLRQNGYLTGFVGKFGVKLDTSITLFDTLDKIKQAKTNEYEGKILPQSYYMSEKAIDFIETAQKKSGKPWMLSLSFWNPHAHDRDKHDQYHYPEEFDALYSDVRIPPSPLSHNRYFEVLPDFLQQSMGRERWEHRFGSEDTYQKMVKRHFRAITGVDKALGMIVSRLEALGIAGNTIVVYTGDNGYSLNDRQLAGKWFGWDEDLRVPLIIYDPRQKRTSTHEVKDVALNSDIAATILDYAGVEVPASHQGNSLKSLSEGKPTNLSGRDAFFFEHSHNPKGLIPSMEGVRNKVWKYVRFPDHGYEQLYYLPADPLEINNLAEGREHQEVLARLRHKTSDYIRQYIADRRSH